jgi:hypothetical protein
MRRPSIVRVRASSLIHANGGHDDAIDRSELSSLRYRIDLSTVLIRLATSIRSSTRTGHINVRPARFT